MMPVMAKPNPESKPGKSKSSGGSLKPFFAGLFVGIFLTAATGWYFVVVRNDPRVRQAWDSWDAQLVALHLTGDDIKQELDRTGRVVRRQARELGKALAESDAGITAKIKAKLLADRELSAAGISVNTTAGRVTLAGHVASLKQIGRAIALAYDTDGVREVTSTLQVKP